MRPMTPELRQLRYVVAVARERSLTRAAEALGVAQQALSQQVISVEKALGVQLFDRTNRGVTITPAGEIFVQEARRALNAADRVVRRTQAAARGEAGTLRIAYTLATVYETLPALVDALAEAQPELKVRPQEVFGADIPRFLSAEQAFDAALAPRSTLAGGLQHHAVRHEELMAVVSLDHPLAAADRPALSTFAPHPLQLWPREMAPGYHDAVLAACRSAGFEPTIDETAAGSSVWGTLARGVGFGLVVRSSSAQLPRGLVLVALAPPVPHLTIDLICPTDPTPAVRRLLGAATGLSTTRAWLQTP
jgi:DNA-binding transcriptional LysR family regulator